jgi:hypothetical protein
MTRLHSLAALLLLAFLSSSRPARAQSGASLPTFEGLERTASTIGLVYAVGGTLTFLTIDLAFAAQEKAIPLEAAVPQFVYAATLLAAGAIAATQGDGGVSAGLVATGATLVAIPIIDLTTRGRQNRPRASLRFTPTAVTFSGTF